MVPAGNRVEQGDVVNAEIMPARPGGEFLLYRSEDGRSRLEVRLLGESVWLSLNQMAELFQRDKSVISRHISNVFAEDELRPEAVVAKYATTAADGKSYNVEYFNLDVIISVGYRVRSHRGTQFRQWATQRLREYVVKGFALDDERLKQSGRDGYFDELLARIRDIRATEKLFWRKVLDIYATSMDYDPAAEASKRFVAVVQNKMHWAAHGHTAAEVIHLRADASAPNMGLNSFIGAKPRQQDTEVAKNYLGPEELDALNRIVSLYLDFAELQALNRTPMYMRDWIGKLDDFLRLSGREVLEHAGKVSHETALEKARGEYEKFRRAQAGDMTPVERDFEVAAKALEGMGKEKKSSRPRRAMKGEGEES
jgi:hypothetical protein